MSKTISTDHAFPRPDVSGQTGLTKREYFACAIMASISSKYPATGDAAITVKLVDALIDALNKETTT